MSPWDGEHKRGGFHSGVEYYFRVVRTEDDGTRLISQQGYFVPNCVTVAQQAVINPDLYASDDWIVAPRLGIDAPRSTFATSATTALSACPIGAYDTVRYNFGAFPQLDSRPGGPGTVLIGGHVDYYVVGLAVFAPLRQAQIGDVIEYWDGNVKYTYVVDWVSDINYDQSLNPYVQQQRRPGGPNPHHLQRHLRPRPVRRLQPPPPRPRRPRPITERPIPVGPTGAHHGWPAGDILSPLPWGEG